VKQVQAAIRKGRVSVFSRITHLVVKHESVSNDRIGRDDLEFLTSFLDSYRMLDKSEMVSLLQQVSPTLEALTMSQCDLMQGIQFPALTSLEQCDSLADDRFFAEEAIQSCPRMRQLVLHMLTGRR
jgi:hypothetical protein